MSKKNQQQDLNDFLSIETESQLNEFQKEHLIQKLHQKISTDLVSSKIKIILLYIFFSSLMYLADISLCAQESIELGEFSHRTFVFFKTHLDPWSCSCITGFLFTSIPFLLTLFLFSKFQKRFLILKLSWLVLLTPLFSVFILFFLHCMQKNNYAPYSLLIWTTSAVIPPYGFYFLFYFLLRQKKIPQNNLRKTGF